MIDADLKIHGHTNLWTQKHVHTTGYYYGYPATAYPAYYYYQPACKSPCRGFARTHNLRAQDFMLPAPAQKRERVRECERVGAMYNVRACARTLKSHAYLCTYTQIRRTKAWKC
jgi:hypothetical protein